MLLQKKKKKKLGKYRSSQDLKQNSLVYICDIQMEACCLTEIVYKHFRKEIQMIKGKREKR